MKYMFSCAVLLTGMLTAAGWVGCRNKNSQAETSERDTAGFVLTSEAFKEGQPIPKKYTADGENVSPPLAWIGAPEGTKAFALIVDDPDAPRGIWVHWVLYGIPSKTAALSPAIGRGKKLDTPAGAMQGKNSFGRIGYDGPAPPKGKSHRYFFKLYALDEPISLQPGASKEDLLKAMKGHIIGGTRLMGTYKR